MTAPVLILAGGTGGHIFPGLAVARELIACSVPVRWMGSAGGMETRLVPEAGITIDTIAVRGLRGKGATSWLTAPFKLMRALWQSLQIVRSLKPRAVISFGGFAAGPGGLAAWLLRRPLIVHEQNRAPGLTNRLLARFATRVLCGFPQSFSDIECETVGNPVRPAIAAIAEPALRLADRMGPIRVLVLGGSQGARALNLELPAVFSGFSNIEIRHQCGASMLQETQAAYAKNNVSAQIEAFITDMSQAYSWADLVVARAGASTLAELCAAGVASVLVPFPGAVDDHQARNAEFMAQAGASVWLRQGDGFAQRIGDQLKTLLADRSALLSMAQNARRAALPQAAQRVAQIAISLGEQGASR